MKRIKLSGLFGFFFGAILVLSAANLANSAIVSLTNPGFENGTTGWTAFPSGTGVSVVTSYTTPLGYTYNPAEGTKFLKLESQTGGFPLSVYQPFAANQGDQLSGSAAFEQSGGSAGAVLITIWFLGQPVWYKEASTNGWVTWNWSAPLQGSTSYTLQYTIQNTSEGTKSVAIFDAVPIPTTALLLVTGLVALVAVRRRRQRGTSATC